MEAAIPEFNPSQELHTMIAEAGATAAAAAGKMLAELRQERGDRLTVGIVPPRDTETAPYLHRG